MKSENGLTPLHCAVCYMLDGEVVELLLGRGADVNAKTTDDGQTPLHHATQVAGYDTLELLVKHGADLYANDFAGRTPLDLAREHNNSRAVVFLEDVLAEDRADHMEKQR